MIRNPRFARRRSRQRTGFSTFEVIVAVTLAATVLALAAPLILAHNRLLIAQRHYQAALAELSNQSERLSLLSAAELPEAVKSLQPSEFASERLAGAKIRGDIRESKLGTSVTLEISWDEINREAAPVRLTTWIVGQEATP